MPRFHGVLLAFIGGLSAACAEFSQAQPDSQPEVSAEATALVDAVAQVVALGRLSPAGEVIQLSVPNAEDSRVNQILIEEGDFVEAGEVIAILQGFERRQRDLEEAQKTVELYQARLAQLRAGEGKQAEIAAQAANIDRLEAQQRNEILEREAAIVSAEAELRQAQLTYDRNRALVQDGALSQAQLDQSREDLERAAATLAQRQAQLRNTQQTLSEQIEQERNMLANLTEVRPVDVQVAQAELERAKIAVEQRQADLADTQVRVPVAGQILRINTRVGERVNTQEGIVELGNTQQMVAIAEIYETDVAQVAVGQPATLTSEYGGFEGSIRGTVEHIGLQVGTRSLSEGSTNPTTDENQRVVEVRIQIHPDDSPKVASLTNMQVRVEIDTSQPGRS
ncbi:MAG: HlyD family efflux transporter periplasmic adaptor subunit [Leptolyngbya sp. SIO4C1]|nr:HlyD family efflux transporter periplasmic adaptor subunit [Leptolyngbya sp. SIO4C1]